MSHLPRRLVLVVAALALCLVLVIVLGKGLSLAALQAPRVVRIEPSDGATEILPTSSVVIDFSTPMQSDTTEHAIRIEPDVIGSFAWDDSQSLVFTPETIFPISTTLTIRVGENARSWLGRPLEQAAQTQFTTLTHPHVVASTPAYDAQFVYVPDRVTLTFNRALDPKTLAAEFEISPTLQNRSLTWNQQSLTLSGFFEPRTRYQIKIPADVPDAEHGIPLDRDLKWSFTTATQYPNLSILERTRVLHRPASDPITIPVQLTNVSRLDAALFSIPRAAFDANADAPYETWYAFQPALPALKTWSMATNATLDEYAQMSLVIDGLAAGTYLIKLSSPEGPDDAKLLLLE